MKRRLPLGTLLLLKVILVLAAHIEGCGYQEERAAPQTAEVETPPLAAAAAIDKAHNLLNVRQPEEAERILREALEVAPNHAQLNNLLGAALVELSNFAEAEDLLPQSSRAGSNPSGPLGQTRLAPLRKAGKGGGGQGIVAAELKTRSRPREGSLYTWGLYISARANWTAPPRCTPAYWSEYHRPKPTANWA